MKTAPMDKIITAAEMGLSMAETCRLLDVSQRQISNAVKKYGIKFVSGHVKKGAKMRGQPKPKIDWSIENKRDPYAASDETKRKAVFKKKAAAEIDRQIKMEITYGYCLYEFELSQSIKKLRPSMPCRIRSKSLEAKQ